MESILRRNVKWWGLWHLCHCDCLVNIALFCEVTLRSPGDCHSEMGERRQMEQRPSTSQCFSAPCLVGCWGIKSESLSPWAFCEGSDRHVFWMHTRQVGHPPPQPWVQLHSCNKISAPMLTLCHLALLMRCKEEDTLSPFHLAASAFSSPSTFLSLCHHFSLPCPQTSKAEASSRSSSRGRGRGMRRWSSMLECEMCDEISASYTVLWRTGNYPNPTCFFTGSIPKALCLGFLTSESISCYHPHVLCWEWGREVDLFVGGDWLLMFYCCCHTYWADVIFNPSTKLII